MAFLDLVSELTGLLQGLSPQLAAKHINRAYQEILSDRNWSFLVGYGAVICPPQVTTGSASITQFDDEVTLDATASAALLAQADGSTLPGLTNLQIRFAPTAPPGASQIYNILAVDQTDPTALVLTLDRIVLEATSATSTIQVYRCYVTPPIDDFKSWLSFVDMANGFAWTGERLTRSSVEFDRRDPQRTSQGLAYFLGNYTANRISDPVTGAVVPNPNVNQGTPIYELWPHPTQGQKFYVRFRRQGVLFDQPTDVQAVPNIITDGMIVQRALGWHSYAFAQANATQFPQFKGVNWVQLVSQARSYYDQQLLDAKRNDNETQLQDVWNRGHGLRGGGSMAYPYPIDSNFIQSHLVNI